MVISTKNVFERLGVIYGIVISSAPSYFVTYVSVHPETHVVSFVASVHGMTSSFNITALELEFTETPLLVIAETIVRSWNDELRIISKYRNPIWVSDREMPSQL